MHEVAGLYPAVKLVHGAGILTVLVTIVAVDLRILGVARHRPMRAFARRLLPWTAGALFLVVIPSGLAMFAAQPATLLNQPAFQLKMALLLAAGMNAAIFHTGPFTTVRQWDTALPAPPAARASALISLALWLSIATCGLLLPTPQS